MTMRISFGYNYFGLNPSIQLYFPKDQFRVRNISFAGTGIFAIKECEKTEMGIKEGASSCANYCSSSKRAATMLQDISVTMELQITGQAFRAAAVALETTTASSSLSHAASWQNWCGLRKRSGQQTFSIIFGRHHYSTWAADDLHCKALLTRPDLCPIFRICGLFSFVQREL